MTLDHVKYTTRKLKLSSGKTITVKLDLTAGGIKKAPVHCTYKQLPMFSIRYVPAFPAEYLVRDANGRPKIDGDGEYVYTRVKPAPKEDEHGNKIEPVPDKAASPEGYAAYTVSKRLKLRNTPQEAFEAGVRFFWKAT